MHDRWWLFWALVTIGCAANGAPKHDDSTFATRAAGRLPPEVIQKVVREHYDKFRICYEQGLARDPALAGKVVTRFIIGRTGKVTNTSIGEGTTLGDQQVAKCVVTAFYELQFPEPQGGIVKVVYPIMLSPG